MRREIRAPAARVVVVLDGDNDAGYRLARQALADGHCVVAVARHATAAVRIMHGHPAERVMVIAADTADHDQWERLAARVLDRFGRIDAVIRGEGASLAETA